MIEPELTEIARARHKILSYLDARERADGSPVDACEIARPLGRSEGFTRDVVRVGEQLGLVATSGPAMGVAITPHGRAALTRDTDAIR